MTPAIFGLSGTVLSEAERAFFRDANPAGFIMFGRNVADRDQLRALTDDLRSISGRDDVPILIDQEGGRVARMGPPVWPVFPGARAFDALYSIAPMSAIEAARVNAAAIALMLADVGITVNCLPLLDIGHAETHADIGDRVFGADPLRVAALGRAVLDGLRSGGVVGVVKHMPGQGRARVDSHHHLPRVEVSEDELARDLAPFVALNGASIAMTGHVVFEAWDSERPATMSAFVIENIIRQRIGFDGLLMSDDLHMKALSGDVPSRARGCIAAGCDLALACHASIGEMGAIASTLPPMTEKARARLAAAMATISGGDAGDVDALIAKRDELLGYA